MSVAFGEVVSTPGEAEPYKVVIRHREKTISEHPVASLRHGEALIAELLPKISQHARYEGDLDT